jgi:hypothetical protein
MPENSHPAKTSRQGDAANVASPPVSGRYASPTLHRKSVAGRVDGLVQPSVKDPDAVGAKRGAKSNVAEVTHNPYAMSRERMFEILRKTNVLTRSGQLTKAFK